MFIGLGQSVSRAYGTIADAMPIMTTPPTLMDVGNAPDLNLTAGQILFDHVSFGYGEADAVVRDLSLAIAAGENHNLHRTCSFTVSLRPNYPFITSLKLQTRHTI